MKRIWQDEGARPWKARPGALSRGDGLPWRRILGPDDLGRAGSPDLDHAAAYLFVDFLDARAGREFAEALGGCPGQPRVLGEESVKTAQERFRPQQTKRLGPGLLAAEILMPAEEVAEFLDGAEQIAGNIEKTLDAEVYYLADGRALVIAGYLTDHRRADFALDLMLAPVLLDLAMSRHRGRPYVLGRWQSAYFDRRFEPAAAQRLRELRRTLDAADLVNRGVLFGPRLHGPLGTLATALLAPGVRVLRWLYQFTPAAVLLAGVRRILRAFAGPAYGGGQPVGPVETPAPQRAIGCVNCGECNSVCPIFQDSRIRLPQMLTHLVESAQAGGKISTSGSVLLDLCMRCGNCEEVCQAGIPHLDAYAAAQQRSDSVRMPEPDRHAAILGAVRASPSYVGEFLNVRPGGYLKRTPASLPGVSRYVLLRAENDAGPAATCIHCGACVPVCPTRANREFEAPDPRLITTHQESCIGCGTCVEVCPANVASGGQTLRVFEAPTQDWFDAVDEFVAGQRKDRG